MYNWCMTNNDNYARMRRSMSEKTKFEEYIFMYAPMNRGLCLDLGVGAVGGGQKATQQAHGWRLHDASGGPQGVAAGQDFLGKRTS